MRRLGMVAIVIILLVGSGVPLLVSARGAPVPADQPNVVVVVTDDMQTTDWQALPRTRERLADGTTFPNFFITTPICCPSRTNILTGMYSRTSGVRKNGGSNGGWEAFEQHDLARHTIGAALQASGYRTGFVGKFINGYDDTDAVPEGWSHWIASNNNHQNYTDFTLIENGTLQTYQDDYLTDVQRAKAVEFIRTTPDDTPLYLHFTPKAPHPPSIPAPRHEGAFAGARVERTPSFLEADVSDKPAYIRDSNPRREERLDAEEQRRLESLLAVDEAIIAIVDELEHAGRLDNTYVFILSDNGWMAGHHNWRVKQVPYDRSIRVEMLAWGPRFTPGVDERMAATIDIAPTVAELAGTALPRADGESIFTVSRDRLLIDSRTGKADYNAIRTLDYLYVEHRKTGERELYDYRTDPYELDNQLADWLGHTPTADPALVAELRSDLRRLVRDTAPAVAVGE